MKVVNELLSFGSSWKRSSAIFAGVAMALCIAVPISRRALADAIPQGWEASNMKPIGYSDLEGHGAFKMTIRHIGDHWYLYMGHLWMHGWSIVDVTDSANPKLVKTIPGPDNTWTIQMEMHDNLMITALQSESPEWGGSTDPKAPFDEGVLLWDISEPLNPKQLSHWKTGAAGTHRNGYPGGKYTYLAASQPGYKGMILLILDVSDPKNPKEAGRWWMPGQKEGEPPLAQPTGFHGPPVIDGNRAYLAYGPNVVILDISDISKPKLVGQLSYSPPFKGGATSGHDVLKIPGKPLLFVHSEGSGGDTDKMVPTCSGPPDITAMVDIKDETKPRLMSLFPLPVPPKDVPYTDFCDKGGRFGPHNTNLEQHLPDVEKQANLIYLTYFNAGLRIFDVEDPRLPKEVGWFIPPQPTKRIGPIPAKLVQQTEDVLVDTRGNVYITDKQWGLFVLRYTGKGEPAPTAK
jgi:hypothetical protein